MPQLPHNAYIALKNQADALVAVPNNDATANEVFATAISNQATAVDEATTAAAIATATATLKTAMRTYATTAQPTNDECFDITFMIENPHFTEGTGGNAVATGWTLAEGGWITEHRRATHNFEAWHAHFDLSQTITDLPKGYI